MSKVFYTKSTAETERLAENIAGRLSPCVIAMTGDLGAGKTAFTRGLARGLGFGDNLEYADELTLGRSIVNRQIFKP